LAAKGAAERLAPLEPTPVILPPLQLAIVPATVRQRGSPAAPAPVGHRARLEHVEHEGIA